jgi:hypothetical protein
MEFLIILVVVILGLGLLGSMLVGGFFLLVQLGVIAKKATEPVYTDSGDYFIEQGREVGKDD